MFLPSDTALLTVVQSGPLFPGQDRPGQPRHGQGEVVEPAQDVVGRDRARLQRLQEVFRPRLQDRQGAERIERVFLQRTYIPFACALLHPLLGFDQFVHDGLPGPRHDVGIAGGKIGAGDLQVDRGLTVGLILGVQQAHCFDPVCGA